DREVPHQKLLLAIATASAAGTYFCGHCQGDSLVRIVHLMEEGFGATEADVDLLIETVRDRLDAVSPLFQVTGSTKGSPTELMSMAMEHLASLAVTHAMARQRPDEPSQLMNEQNGP